MNDYKLEKIWDPFIRVWHWLLVLSVVTGWLLGEFRTFSVMQWHIYLGYITGVLLLLRIVWGFAGPQPVRFKSLIFYPVSVYNYSKTIFRREPSAVPGHNPLGALSVIILLVLLCAQVITGLFSEDDALFYAGPLASELSSAMVVEMTGLHNQFAKLILIFVSLHVAAVLFYLIWKKENLIKAMFTGYKLVKSKRVSSE